MESNIISQFNLPLYVKGKTFAEASKAIDKKFKGRSDKYSEQTKQELLSRLAEAQEYVKIQNDAIKANSTQVPDMMSGDIPQGMEEFASGGIINAGFAKDATAEDQMGAMQGVIQGVNEAYNIGNQLFGSTGIDTNGSQSYEKINKGNAAVSGVMSGASAGAALGPWGAAVGGLIGGGASLFGAGRKNKDIREANKNNTLAETANYRSDFGLGGEMNSYGNGGDLDDIFKINPEAQLELQKQAFGNPLDKVYNKPSSVSADPESEKTDTGLALKRGADWLQNNAGNIMSYSPILGNAIELSKLKENKTKRGDRLNNKYNKQLFDVNSIINNINQNNTKAALTESSGGDLGALRSNILAANLNKTKALSDASIKGNEINRSENKFEFQSDMRRDQINANLEERYIDRKAKDEAAYETTKGNLKRSLYEDIGKVGKDVVNKKLIRDMFGYTWDGEYFVDKKGKKYSQKEVALMKAKKDKIESQNESMFGGYTKTKK